VCFLVFGFAFGGGVGLGSNESMQNIHRSCPLCFLHSAGWTSVVVQGGGGAVDPPQACQPIRSVLTRVFASLSNSITIHSYMFIFLILLFIENKTSYLLKK